MHLRNECECGVELDCEEYDCSCGGVVSEVYDMSCSFCGWSGEQISGDACPECGAECNEE